MNTPIYYLTPIAHMHEVMEEAKEKEERWKTTYWSPPEPTFNGKGGSDNAD